MRGFCSLLSGGKDSTYAMLRAMDAGLTPSCVAVVTPSRPDSWMFHRPFVDYVPLQLESLGLQDRLVRIEVSGEKEAEVRELTDSLRAAKARYEFDTLVIGGIASRYQLTRFSRVAEELNVELFDPQWGVDPEWYMRELVRYGVVYVITQITTAGLPPSFLGVPVKSEEQVEELLRLSRRAGFHPAFEGGEAESFVIKAPRFRTGICLEARRARVTDFEWRLEPLRVYLCDKPHATVDSVTYEA